MRTCISHEDSFYFGKIKEVNSRVPSLQVPFKEAVLPIWASKRAFVAVHIQSRLTFARSIGEAVNVEILGVPRVAVVLQVSEAAHHSLESRVVSSENSDLIFS